MPRYIEEAQRKDRAKGFSFRKYISAVPPEPALIFLVFICISLKWAFLEYTVLTTSESYMEILPFISEPELGRVILSNTVRMAAYSSVFLAFPLIAFLMLPRRAMAVSCLAYNFTVTFMLYADILHIRHFSRYIDLFRLELAPQLFHVAGAVLPLVSAPDALLFADFLLLIPLARRVRIEPPGSWGRNIKTRAAAAAALLIMSASAAYEITETAYSQSDDLYNTQNMGLAAGSAMYHITDAYYFIKDRAGAETPMTPEERGEFESWYNSFRRFNGGQVPCAGAAKGKNLIIIQVESLQSFAVGLRVNGAEITPCLSRIIKRSVYFPDIYDQTLAGGTSDTEFMINTGLYPTADSTVFSHNSDRYYISLPMKLREHGYGSYVFHADRKDFWNRDSMYSRLRYSRFFHRDFYEAGERIGLGLSDRSFLSQTLGMLKELRKPFYASIITLTSHTPFDAREIKEQAPKELSFLGDSFIDNYLRSINYTDRQIGMFVDGLEKAGMLQNSVLIITGDHSAIPVKYKDDLYRLLGIEAAPATDYPLWRSVHKVPLIIRLPGGTDTAGIKPRPGGQIDILPTIAGLFGLKFPLLMGNSLFAPGSGSIVLRSDSSYIVGDTIVLPEKGLAVNMQTGEYRNSTGGEFAEALGTSLKYNDYIIKKNLMPLVMENYYRSDRNKIK